MQHVEFVVQFGGYVAAVICPHLRGGEEVE
jgi:hypothetical protein